MNAVSLRDVWLKYRIEFKEDGKITWEDFWALKGINLDVEKGSSLCIIGENGSGKTSLLKIISGMLNPDMGKAEVNGTVSTLMEIGAGFQKELTGRENVYAISSLFGLTKGEIAKRYEDIIKFAAIGRFINAPVKIYSQGMYMRLAFAIAIHVDPEILLVDDIFSVGDIYAQRKCIDKMFELKDKGKTIIFVTHDIETAKRFCDKGILLKDGRLIKDGPLKESIAYYLKTIGDKNGIGLLQGKHLGIVFNNGKLILNWDNDTLTKEWSGYVSMLSSGNQHSSLKADWEVKECGRDKITMEGKLWDLPVWQSWEIRLDEASNTIDLKVDIDMRDKFDLQEITVCIMFQNGYKYWFNPFKKERFPVDDLSQHIRWECIDSQTPAVNFIGLSAEEKDPLLMPSIAIEDEVYVRGKLLEVQNTDRVFQARVLQSRITASDIKNLHIDAGKHTLFHIKIKVIKDFNEQINYLQSRPKAMLPKIVSGGCGISLSAIENNIVNLFWNDKKISSSMGFKTNFWHNHKIYQSSDPAWTIYRVTETNLRILIQWPDLPLKQIWDFTLLENGRLSWKVYIQVLKEITIENNEFRIMFPSEYSRWITTEAEGDIAEEINSRDFRNIVMKNDPYNIIGLKQCSINNKELPSVLLHDVTGCAKFNSLDKRTDKNTVVENSLNVIEFTTQACFSNGGFKGAMSFPKGSHLLCDINVILRNDAEQKTYMENVKADKNLLPKYLTGKEFIRCNNETLEYGRRRISFDKGKGRIFFDDKEITKNFGLYTSIYSREFYENGQWYASLDAMWETLVYKKNRLVVRGQWPYLPIAQTWEIRAERDRFNWAVDMEVFAAVTVERQQAYLMLSDSYHDWASSIGKSGFFPQDFMSLRWDNLYRENAAAEISASAKDAILPKVSFGCISKEGKFEALIENSNSTFKSRALGFERTDQDKKWCLQPGMHRYFQGSIIVSEK
ncbi:MAG: ABC transporter ATP-binding protein [Deltaproteobacteria bacterium]